MERGVDVEKGAPVPVVLSWHLTVNVKDPTWVGVPDSSPEVLKVRPAGAFPVVME